MGFHLYKRYKQGYQSLARVVARYKMRLGSLRELGGDRAEVLAVGLGDVLLERGRLARAVGAGQRARAVGRAAVAPARAPHRPAIFVEILCLAKQARRDTYWRRGSRQLSHEVCINAAKPAFCSVFDKNCGRGGF